MTSTAAAAIRLKAIFPDDRHPAQSANAASSPGKTTPAYARANEPRSDDPAGVSNCWDIQTPLYSRFLLSRLLPQRPRTCLARRIAVPKVVCATVAQISPTRPSSPPTANIHSGLRPLRKAITAVAAVTANAIQL